MNGFFLEGDKERGAIATECSKKLQTLETNERQRIKFFAARLS